MLNRPRLPRLEHVKALVIALEGTDDEVALWVQAWSRVRAADSKYAAPRVLGEPSEQEIFLQITPHQLPLDPQRFVGRAGSLAVLDSLVKDDRSGTRIALVVGAPGVGKTALAIHWAHREISHFPDGQLYLDLGGGRDLDSANPQSPMSAERALAVLLEGLGVAGEKIPRDPQAQRGLYRSLLNERQMLLLLDNAADVQQVRALLPGGSSCRIVVTSRHQLTGLMVNEGARQLVLNVLDPEEANALLAAVLGEARLAAEPEAVDDLARLCAHLPLALRIAAANLMRRPRQSLASFVQELTAGDRLDLLMVSGDSSAAVRATFDVSYAGLQPDAARLFRHLGVSAASDTSLDAAARLLNVTPEQASPLLDSLIDAHLVEAGDDGRVRFHDLLRLYAQRQALSEETPEKLASAKSRLYDWYVATAYAANHSLLPVMLQATNDIGPGDASVLHFRSQAEARNWLDAEFPNLVAVIHDTAVNGPSSVAWRLVDALRAYCYTCKHGAEWVSIAETGLLHAQRNGDLLSQAAMHLSLALAHYSGGDGDQCIEHNKKAFNRFGQVGHKEGQSAASGNLGEYYTDVGQVDDALFCIERALDVGDPTIIDAYAEDYKNLAKAQCEAGMYDEALASAERAVAMMVQVGDDQLRVEGLRILGVVYDRLGRGEEALQRLEEALRLADRVNQRGLQAEILTSLSALHRSSGKIRKALSLAKDAVEFSRVVGSQALEGHALTELAAVHRAFKDYDLAVETGRSALHIHRKTGRRLGEGRTLVLLGEIYRDSGDPISAEIHWRKALAIMTALNVPDAKLVRQLIKSLRTDGLL